MYSITGAVERVGAIISDEFYMIAKHLNNPLEKLSNLLI